MIDCSDFNHISSRKQILWTPSIGKLPDIKVTVYKLFPMFQTFHDHLYVMFTIEKRYVIIMYQFSINWSILL